MQAQVGDEVVVETPAVGRSNRRGRVQEILGSADTEHFRVRWDDGRESVYFPGAGGAIVRPTTSIPFQPQRRARPSASARPEVAMRQILSTSLVRVDETATLRTVASRLAAAEVGALVVMQLGTPLGLVTDRALVTALAAGGDPDLIRAADVIGDVLVWASVDDPMGQVADTMRDAGVRHVLIRDRHGLAGIAALEDVLAAALDAVLPTPA